jgi:ComEC/Rec2-related protein
MRRRPLIGLAAAGVIGTLAGLGFRPPPALLLAVLLPFWLLLTILLFSSRARLRPALTSLALIALACGLATLAASLAASPIAPADIREWLPRERQAGVTVTGIVSGDPSPIQRGGVESVRFPLELESAQTRSNAPSRSCRGHVMVTWVNPRQVPPPCYGEQWRVEGRLTSTDPVAIRTGPYGAWFQARERGAALRQFCEKQRREAWKILSIGVKDHPDAAGLLSALTLGTRLNLPAALKDDFMTTGTFHVVAISGLHVGMIAWLLASVLRLGGISRVWWFPILAPLLIVYTMGTGASASALRACIMACLFFAASLFGRKEDSWSALSASALLILALDPWQVLDRGFILSFCLVGGLLLMAPLLARSTPSFLKPDPFIARELIPKWKQMTYWALKGIWATIALSGAAWFTSLPLSAYFFGRISLVALLANLVAIPASFLIVLTGCFSLAFGSVWLPLAEVFNYANLAIITVLIKALDLLAAIPFASVNVPRPPLWVLPVWYAGLIALALWMRSRPKPEEAPFG